jgi:Chitobiase/beta-hexosaminidase C-terminal domain
MRTKGLLFVVLFFALFAAALLALPSPARASWPLQKLTDNTYDDTSPQIDAGQVVWQGRGTGAPFDEGEIYFYNSAWAAGSPPVNLSDPNHVRIIHCYQPQIDAGQVVWQAYEIPTDRIALCNIDQPGSLIFLDAPRNFWENCYDPQIDAGQVVWRRVDVDPVAGTAQFEIYFYDSAWPPGSASLDLSNNPTDDGPPLIDRGQVAWVGYDGRLCFYDSAWPPGSAPLIISKNVVGSFAIEHGRVVWWGADGLQVYDSREPAGTSPKTLIDDTQPTRGLQMDNGKLVWEQYDGNDWEIYSYDLAWAPGTAPLRLTDNTNDDTSPQIDAGQAVWQGFDGQDWEIYSYDLAWAPGTAPLRLTDNTYDDTSPQIDAGQVVWQGFDGQDWEIFLASSNVVPSSSSSYRFAPNSVSGWHNTSQTVAIVAGPTATAVHFSTDGGSTWTRSPGDNVAVAISAEGSHHFEYFASNDVAQEAVHDAGYVNIDTARPSTIASGLQADNHSGWINHSQTVTLTPADTGGSGVAHTYYTVDGVQHTYSAPFSVSAAGSHTITYWCADSAGNEETPHNSGHVNIDTAKPSTIASAVKGKAGATVTLRFTVTDPAPSCGFATVTVAIMRGKKVVTRIHVGSVATNTPLTFRYKRTLKKGAYTYRVLARDIAGNAATSIGSAKLTVK